MKGILQQPQPNIDRFIQVIRGEVIPERPPLIEYLVDHKVMRAVVTEGLGRKWVEPDWNDRETLRPFLDNYISMWYSLGYDFVRIEFDAGFEMTALYAPDPGTAGETTRAWADLQHGPIHDWQSFESYSWPDKPSNRNLWILEYIEQHLPDGMGMITCHGGGIFEIIGRLLSYSGLCLALYDQPDLVAAVAERAGRCIENYYTAFLEIPSVRMVLQGDDMGHRTGLLISAKDMKQYCLPWHKRFAALTHEKGLPYCLHSCGQVMEIMPALIEEVGIDGKHSFEDVIIPASEFYDRYGDRIAVLGGVDINVLSACTPDEVRCATRTLIEHCAESGRFAIGSGNSIPSYIPVENYLAMLDEAHK
ncbi:MAG: uroporphyrinogen decarboxylase family protein [bacterium]